MKYRRKTDEKWKSDAYKLGCLIGIVFIVFTYINKSIVKANEIISPLQEGNPPAVIYQTQIVEKEVPVGCETEKCQIMAYIVEVFQDDADDAITIINKCENSKFDTNAVNWNSNGTWDAGIMMVNEVHGYSMEQMKDWKQNIDAGYKIFKNRGWTAWACSHVVGVKSFWQ